MILPAIVFDGLLHRLNIFNNKSHVMQTVEILTALVARLLVGLELQNRGDSRRHQKAR